jgi:sec-independent protein translocase protein TatC
VNSAKSVGAAGDEELASMPLVDHIRELRRRVLISVGAVLAGALAGLALVRPAIAALQRMCTVCAFVFYGPTESFAAYFRVAALVGLVIALPVVLYQAVAFVVPGLHRNERRLLYVMLPSSALLFTLGVLFGYWVVVPRATSFLSTFLIDSAAPTWSLGLYIAFATNLLLGIGLAFQTPRVVFVLAKLGVATPQRLAHYRRYAILAMAILAAVLTPTPDPVTMFLVLIPMVLLYELGVALARLA